MSSILTTSKKPVKSLLGKRFGRLEVVELLGKGKYGKYWWRCFCDCGGWVDLSTQTVNSETTQSCGCLTSETLKKNRFDGFKHGKHKHPLYAIYHGMLQRCYNPNSQRYKYYGSSGIAVCAYWSEDFMNFYDWAMSNGYQDGLSIDRLDSSEDYCPENCEWVTVSENSRRMNANRNR